MPEARIPDVTLSRLSALVDAVELGSSPTFALTATPHPLVDATDLLAADTAPISRAFLQPPELRDSGFDLDAIGTPIIHDGRARRSLMPEYKARELWTDGVLLFVATGGEDFLSWGDRSPKQPLQVNSLPLIESTLLFCKLVQSLFSATPAAPSHVIYSVHLLRLCIDSKPPRLSRRHVSSPKMLEAPGCDFQDILVKAFPGEPAVTAFELVRSVHAWFQLTYDRVPFARDGRVDEQQLISLR